MKSASFVALAMLALAGCGGTAGLALPIASVTVSVNGGSLLIGSHTQLTATGLTQGGESVDVSWAAHWESSNPALIQISGEGSSPEAIGVSTGKASVTAIVDQVAASANLEVVSPPTQPRETPAGL
jgi:hypothetical protein